MMYSEERQLGRAAASAELLDAETEAELARAWRDRRDEAALHRLITAYMRLAISMAAKFRRYGVPMGDLIQEANLGLMKAADKFDPDRGVRFSTYAMWWIKASVQDHVLRNWSLVRTGSTSAQKSLFFNLRRIEARISRAAGEGLAQEDLAAAVARELGVSEAEVRMMQGRLSGGDMSLDAPQRGAGEEEGRAWVDLLEDEAAPGQEGVELAHDAAMLRQWLASAMALLSARERFILRERRLGSAPRTLEDLGREMGLSKERVRQLEAGAFAKMRADLSRHGEALELFLS